MTRTRRGPIDSWIRCSFLFLVVLVPSTTRAEELVLGAAAEYVYNSNFFNAPNDEEAASSFLIGPTFNLSEDEGRFRYDLDFTGAYQAYVDQDGVDAWESFLRARGVYDFTSRTSLQVTERFRDVSNLRFSRQDIGIADNAVDPNQDRYFRNDVEALLTHQLFRHVELRFEAGYHWIDFEDNIDRNDNESFDVGGEVRFQVASDHALGAGVTYLNQDFEKALSRLGSESESINAFASWTWDIAENIVFTANGGPVWVRSNEDNSSVVTQTQFIGGEVDGNLLRAEFAGCGPIIVGPGTPLASNCAFTPQFPGIPAADLGAFQSYTLLDGGRANTSDEFTFFGGASILANFAEWNVEFTYSRRQSTTSGASVATSLDRLYLELEYAPPNLRWSTFVASSWERREALTESTRVDFRLIDGPGGAAQRLDAFTFIDDNRNRRDEFTAITGVRGELTRNQGATLEFRYRRTEVRNVDRDLPSVDTFFVVLTYDFVLDPFRF
jgi:hypothetical protein